MKTTLLFLTLLIASAASSEPVIDQTVIRQQWPWSTEVNVDFNLTGASASAPVDVFASFTSAGAPVTVEGAAATNGDVSASAHLTSLAAGGHLGFSFDPAVAFPGVKQLPEFRVALRALTAEQAKFLVIDLSGGADADVFPHFFTNEMSAAVLASDDCRTTQLWLRRIPAGSVTMGTDADHIPSGLSANQEANHYKSCTATLTRDFYAAVFELTARQYSLIAGTALAGDGCLPQKIVWDDLRGPVTKTNHADAVPGNFPKNGVVTSDSLIGILRRKTGFTGFDLPTNAQWERAARADAAPYAGLYHAGGYTADHAESTSDPALAAIAVVGTSVARVGTKAPNGFGLYDVVGNVSEWCLDYFIDTVSLLASFGGENPHGPSWGGSASTSHTAYFRTLRGGACSGALTDLSLYKRHRNSSNASVAGARLVVNLYPYLKQ